MRTQTLTPGPAFTWWLPADVTAPAAARQLAGETATSWGLTGLAGDLTICVSELVTNAVVHDTGPVTVRLTRRPASVLCEVADTGRRLPRACELGPAAERGRGPGAGGCTGCDVWRAAGRLSQRTQRQDGVVLPGR